MRYIYKNLNNNPMKVLQILLILSAICYCFSDDLTSDECYTKFDQILNEKCQAINTDSCRYNNFYHNCKATNACSSGDGDESKCKKIVHPNFHKKKCKYNSSNQRCEEVDKECADYGLANPYAETTDRITLSGDTCSELNAGTGTGRSCKITSRSCQVHYSSCGDCPNQVSCEDNIPSDPKFKCYWDNTGVGSCKSRKRVCGQNFQGIEQNVCSGLQLTDTTDPPIKACVYSYSTTNPGCIEEFISCDNSVYNTGAVSCDGKIPLLSTKTDYDYSKICEYNTETNKCSGRDRKCSEFNNVPDILLEEKCSTFKATYTYQRCAFDSNSCYEEFLSCQAYTENEIEKTRGRCESIKLLDSNKECVYIPEEDKCEERNIYTKCEEYEGSDRKICESIISPNTNSYCILDKDSKCKDRVPYCSEVSDEDDCIYYAKPVDANKICAYNYSATPRECYEEYARCEDYLGNDTTTCEDIISYKGNKCEFVSNRCRTTNKVCEEALIEEECKLIKKTGVTDPDKKVCYYTNGDCKENYKYCSDFREIRISTNSDYEAQKTKCENIEPYDESGNEIDIFSKCVYESGVGCQRVPKDCKDAKHNPVLCSLYSPKIKDNSVKHCVFYNNDCKEHFKKCDNVKGDFTQTDDQAKCAGNIIENYITNECEVDTSSTPRKCVQKKNCNSFSYTSYEELCKSINPNCTFSSTLSYCHTTTKDCENTKFYNDNEENAAICKSIEASVPYKICSLKSDKSGCEEIYRELRYSSSASAQQDSSSSSGFIAREIHLILILLFVLF